jgi:hypothetical protein
MSERRRGYQRKEKPAACPFCEERVPRPAKLEEADCEGGRCSCGALFIADLTGKLGGQALVDGLTLLAGGDQDRGMSLERDKDYRMMMVGYRPRTHSLEPRVPKRGGAFGMPKLWFFRLIDE